MKHLGDITKISGYDVPTVDCVIGGSPCQDLSVAGKRAGLDGERSGLFMEQLRIIKEMRDNDKRNGRTGEFIRPRFMVWENVPGALSSNKGQDFRIVLEEIAKIADEDAVVPMPPKDKWTNSGCIVGDGWSIAWRILDSQFWGVPQRRRRIALVADFGGGCAQEILFVRKGLSRDIEESRESRQGASEVAQGCVGADDSKRVIGYGISSYNSNAMMSDNPHSGFYEADTARTLDGNGGNPCCNQGGIAVVSLEPGIAQREGGHIYENVSGTLRANSGDNQMSVACVIENHPADSRVRIDDNGIVQALTSRMGTGGGNVPMVVMDRSAYNQGINAKFDIGIDEDGKAFSCLAKGPGAVAYIDTSHADDVVRTDDVVAPLQARDYKGGKYVLQTEPHYIVRWLTPHECERLQGYPDGWTDIGDYTDTNGKKCKASDSARYKALGNSIALPLWKWVLKRLCSHYERDATMASLFDGIGGFPYIWEQLNGKGSCLWASEIEEFPIAVTKRRINDKNA